MKELTQEEWREKLEQDDKAVVLDVRTEITSRINSVENELINEKLNELRA